VNCPVCTDERLVMADRQGIEIDYCPRCRGVWLDRGELDKLIDKAAAAQPAMVATLPTAYAPPPAGYQQQQPPPRRYDDDDKYYGKKKKRSSFLGEILDF
jgi:hypothetical protein